MKSSEKDIWRKGERERERERGKAYTKREDEIEKGRKCGKMSFE